MAVPFIPGRMGTTYQIVVCAGIVPDPLQTLEPVVVEPEDALPDECRALFPGVVLLLPLLAKGELRTAITIKVAGALIDPKSTGSQKFQALLKSAAFYGLWYPLKGDVYAYLLVTGTIYLASISTLLIACCYWKRANNWGAIAAIVLGAALPVLALSLNLFVLALLGACLVLMAAVRAFGGEVAMTSPACLSGTDRVAEVARRKAAAAGCGCSG